MKVLCLTSSCRLKGNTVHIVEYIEKHLKQLAQDSGLSLEIEKIHLGQQEIGICKGCRICFDQGESYCPQKDNFLKISDLIKEADGIIIASPVYVEDVNGVMKNWIDRMAFYNHRPGFAGKKAFVITTSGVGSSNHAIRTLKSALNAWGFKVVGQMKFRMGALMDLLEMEEAYEAKTKHIAMDLLEAIKRDAFVPSFYSLLVFRVQQLYWQKSEIYMDTIDYAYWSQAGWLQPGCDYYTAHKASKLKVMTSRILASLVAKVFI